MIVKSYYSKKLIDSKYEYVRSWSKVIEYCCDYSKKIELYTRYDEGKITLELGYDGGETLCIPANYCPSCGKPIKITEICEAVK